MSLQWDTIYLSPHLDDAILSCGGQIFQETSAGKTVLVVTITAGDPPRGELSDYGQSLHRRWLLTAEDSIAARRAEDVAACAAVGASVEHWDVPDCIYRRHPSTDQALYASDEDIFGDIHPAELSLVDRLAQRMGDLPIHDHLVVPLTAGHHVDHQLTQLAVERCFDRFSLVYYEDYPYAGDDHAVRAALSGDEGWQSRITPLGDAALAAKIKAIACYTSQISTFFSNIDDMAAKVRAFARQRGGERFWFRSRQDTLINGRLIK